MLYGYFGEDGRIIQAVNDLTIIEVPAGAVELTEEQWHQRFNLRLDNDLLVLDPIELPEQDIDLIRSTMRVKRGQGRIALHNAGLLQQVDDYINNPETDPVIKIAYQDALEWHRNSNTTAAIQGVLQLTDIEVDDLFAAAAAVMY